MLRDRVAHPGQADLVDHLDLLVVVQQDHRDLRVPVDRLDPQALAVQGQVVRVVPLDQVARQGHLARLE